MFYPESLQNLIECYKKFSGIGEKSAERMALCSLEFDDSLIETFAQSLLDIKQKIKRCTICNNLTESDICGICSNKERNQKTICVVEEPKNVFQFEKSSFFNGVYHVLDGLISPLDDINPEDINIESLIKRIKNNDIDEVILAVKPSIEGEATSLYISKLLEDTNVKISKIAHGVPIGADIDYIDSLTLEMAFEERKILETKE